MVSRAQIARDEKAIMKVMPKDGSAISFAQIALQAGEMLGPALRSMKARGLVVDEQINERQHWRLLASSE